MVRVECSKSRGQFLQFSLATRDQREGCLFPAKTLYVAAAPLYRARSFRWRLREEMQLAI
jgi:hypothetical protein